MLLILFGLSGSGKNFVGKILAKKFGYHYWDADTEMPQSMQTQILKKEFFTQKMRDQFAEIIIGKIAKLKDHYQNTVISQALYKEKNRNQIASAYPDAKFIQIKATQKNIIHRLSQRNDWVDPTYAEKISLHFEDPRQLDAVIINDSDEDAVVSQIQKILNKICLK